MDSINKNNNTPTWLQNIRFPKHEVSREGRGEIQQPCQGGC